MDWAVWDHTLDRDVIEETALNEKSCVQVLEVLISNANAEILELEEDLIILKSQLAWVDESWSETCSAALNEKIDCLDISLRSLENADVHDEPDFAGCLLSHKEPAEKMHRLLQPLVENYFNQEHEQNNEQTVNSVVSKEDLSLETEKKDVAEKDKHAHTIIEDLSLDPSGQETDESSEKNESVKFDLKNDGKDGLGKHNSASKERNLVAKSTLKTAGKGRILPRMFEPSSASRSDASEQANGSLGKKSRIDSKVNGRKEFEGLSSTGQIIALKSSVQREGRESNISQPADHPVEFRACALHEVKEESDVNPKLTEGLFSAPTNNIEPPLSSFIVGKKRAKSPWKRKSPDVALANTEEKAVDSLLLLLNNKKELKGKSKLAAIVNESNPNLPPKPQKQRAKRGHQQKQQGKLVVDVDKEKKRKHQSSPGLEEAQKLKSLQISLAKSCANTTASTNAEDLSDMKRLFTSDSMKSETPKLLPSPALPFPKAGVFDLESLTLVDLRAIAKQQKLRGYRSLRKSKLTEQLSLKLMVQGGCT